MPQTELKKNTVSLIAATIISRVFGLLRIQVISFLLGTSRAADIWGLAFMVPDLFRRLISEGALTAAFIPILTSISNEKERLHFSRQIFTLSLLGSGIFSTVIILILPYLMPLLVASAGLDPYSTDVLEALPPSQLVFPFVVFTLVNAVSFSVLNVRGHFFLPAITPVFLSLSMILGGMIAWWTKADPVWGLALGVLCGGFFNFVLTWFVLLRSEFLLIPVGISLTPKVRRAMALWIPTLFGAGIFQLNLLMSRCASFNLFDGAISALDYSGRLTELVIGIFATSITTALLPLLARTGLCNNRQKTNSLIAESISRVSFLAIPASAGLMLAGYPLVGILFKHGEFSSWSQLLTFGGLLIGANALIPLAWYRILSQLFYTHGHIRALVIISGITTALNLIGLLTLPSLFPKSISHLGISLSLLLYTWVLYASISLYARINFKINWDRHLSRELMKNLIATVIFIPVWLPFGLEDLKISTLLLKISLSILLYLGASVILKSQEVIHLKRRLHLN